MPHKPGPKTELGGANMRRRTLTYDETTERMLKVLGAGNASRGVRLAARIAYKVRGLTPYSSMLEPVAPAPPAEAPKPAQPTAAVPPGESPA